MKTLTVILNILFLNFAYGQRSTKNYFQKEIIKVDLSSKTEKELDRRQELNRKDDLTPK